MGLTAGVVQADGLETSGDVLRLALPAAAFGTALLRGDEDGIGQFVLGAGTNVVVTLGLKESVSKTRPNREDRESFPSGHASVAFQAAAFLQRRYGWSHGVPAYLSAAWVGYTRVEEDEHYWSDVAAGAAIGVLSSYLFTEPWPGVTVTPAAEGDVLGLTVSTRW
jgi:membrane-associated phospholipid phosphatase